MAEASGTSVLSEAHISGICFRVGLTPDELPAYFAESGLDKKHSIPGAKTTRPTRNKIIPIVNKTYEEREVRISHALLDEEWFFSSEPDNDVRHIPDIVTAQPLVDAGRQAKTKDTLAGLYYLYRCHGLKKNQGGVRELLFIHEPKGENVRVHLISSSSNVYTGLAYKQRNAINIPLYRWSAEHGYSTRFLLLSGPYATRMTRIDGAMLRMSGSKHEPIALGVVLELQNVGRKILKKVAAEIADVRLGDKVYIDFEASQLALKQFEPRKIIPWEDAEVSGYKSYLQDRIFRTDDLDTNADPSES